MRRTDLWLALASLVLLALVSACYSTTVRSGKPVGQKAADADGRWHSGVLTGGVELSGPFDLDRLCPDGWAKIRTETSVFNQAAELLTFHLYAPQTVHVTCAGPPAGEAPDLL